MLRRAPPIIQKLDPPHWPIPYSSASDDFQCQLIEFIVANNILVYLDYRSPHEDFRLL